MSENKHFSDELIDQIDVDQDKNYFTDILIETIGKIGVPKKY